LHPSPAKYIINAMTGKEFFRAFIIANGRGMRYFFIESNEAISFTAGV